MGFNYPVTSKVFSVKRVLEIVLLITLLCLTFLNLFEYVISRENVELNTNHFNSDRSCTYNKTVEKYFENRKYWITSNLGSIMFKNQPKTYYKQQNRTFLVLIWKHPSWKVRNDLSLCNVKNCIFTNNEYLIKEADVVVFATYGVQVPWVHKRKPTQIWVFVNNESPVNAFVSAKENVDSSSLMEPMANVFNWSMTYRSDSDVPTPYGRIIPLPEDLMEMISSHPVTKAIPYWRSKQRDVLIGAIMSQCNVPEHMNYINELQKYIKVDLYGKCAVTKEMKDSCNSFSDCPQIRKYHFYLAFETSRCREYITEKVFYDAFANGAIPIIMGAPVSDCEKLLPPQSFLHVNSFDSAKDLAMEILNLSSNDDHIELYHEWRHYFKVITEHDSFESRSYELCRLCEALNYNDNKTKVYDLESLKMYLDPKLLCI